MIRLIPLNGAGAALRAWMGAAVASLLCLTAPTPAHADFCPATSCSLTLTNSNFDGTGNFGTVTLNLTSANTVTIDVTLASGFRIIQTGFDSPFGFEDSVGGGLTIGNFKSGGNPDSQYAGGSSLTFTGVGTGKNKDHGWDGFGYSNDAAATTGPSPGDACGSTICAKNEVSFTVSGPSATSASLTNVNQLLNLFSPAGERGSAYFVVDAFDGNGQCGSACTGLLAVTRVPEPGSLVLLGTGLVALGIWRRRKLIRGKRPWASS